MTMGEGNEMKTRKVESGIEVRTKGRERAKSRKGVSAKKKWCKLRERTEKHKQGREVKKGYDELLRQK